MREIKFRAWSKHGIEMQYRSLKEFQERGFGLPLDDEETKVMQFTGLHDKNGKEIYEGDIIRHYLYDKPYSDKRKACEVISEVVWNDGNKVSKNEWNDRILEKDPSSFNQEPCFTTKTIKNEKGFGCCSWSEFSGCEVIGNIYENPSLLK